MTPPLTLRASDHDDVPFIGEAPAWASDHTATDYVIRLGSNDSNRLPEQQLVVGLMARLGVTSCGDWAEASHSSSLIVTGNGPTAWALWQALWRAVSTADVWVTPLAQPPVRLLLCDMDSTLITTESLDELAAYVGIGSEVAQITARAMNGELDFKAALDERVRLLEGLEQSTIDACVASTELSDGAQELMAKAGACGVRTVLISGGFTPFAEHVAGLLNMDHIVANRLEFTGGRLTGRVLNPIVTRETKLQVLTRECEQLGITLQQCCTLGDGANDIAMLQAAGTGVAFRAKEVVLAATPWHLSRSPLSVLTDWLHWPE